MILSEMRTMLGRLLAADLDNMAGESPDSAELTSQINYAIRAVSEEIYQLDPSITLTLTAETGSYNLRSSSVVSRKVIEPVVVVINGNPLWAASRKKYGMWTMTEIQDPNIGTSKWRDTSSGTCTRAVVMDRTLYLWPKPNAAVVSDGSNYIMGQYLAADLVDGVDDDSSPDLPEEVHEAVVRLAAIFASDPSVSESEAIARIGRYESRAMQAIQKTKDRNRRQAQSWGTVTGSRIPDYIYQ